MPACEPVTVVQRASYWLASITHTAHRPPQSHSFFFLANRNSSVIKQVGKMLRKNDSSSIQITIYSNPVFLAAIGLEVCTDPLLANRTWCQVGGFREKSSFLWQVTSVGDEFLSHLFCLWILLGAGGKFGAATAILQPWGEILLWCTGDGRVENVALGFCDVSFLLACTCDFFWRTVHRLLEPLCLHM